MNYSSFTIDFLNKFFLCSIVIMVSVKQPSKCVSMTMHAYVHACGSQETTLVGTFQKSFTLLSETRFLSALKLAK